MAGEYDIHAECVINSADMLRGEIPDGAIAKGQSRADGFCGTFNKINYFVSKKQTVQIAEGPMYGGRAPRRRRHDEDL